MIALSVVVVLVVALGWDGAPARPVAAPRPVRGGATLRRLRPVVEPRFGSLRFVSDRLVVTTLVVSVALAPLILPAVIGGPVLLGVEAIRRQRHASREEERTLVRLLPELIDLLGLAVAAGLALPDALRVIGRWLPEPIAGLVDRTVARIDAGEPLADALAALGRCLPTAGRGPVAVVVSASRDGAPLAPSLERAAAEARRARRRDAEARARRLPVVMLLPLVLCVLPAFVLLTLVPLVLGSLDGLQLPGS